jgi:hypothetical protein
MRIRGKHSLDLWGPDEGLGAYTTQNQTSYTQGQTTPSNRETIDIAAKGSSEIVNIQKHHQVYQASNVLEH